MTQVKEDLDRVVRQAYSLGRAKGYNDAKIDHGSLHMVVFVIGIVCGIGLGLVITGWL